MERGEADAVEQQEERWFKVMYTTHKTQKKKTWQDGYVRVLSNNHVNLYMESDDDNNQGAAGFRKGKMLTSIRYSGKNNGSLETGKTINAGSYLIEFEEQIRNENSTPSQVSDNHEQNQSQVRRGKFLMKRQVLKPIQELDNDVEIRVSQNSEVSQQSAASKYVGLSQSQKNNSLSQSGDVGDLTCVRKFEIMFTAQKKQKSKKWKDGFLVYQDGVAKIYEEDQKTYAGKKTLVIPDSLDDDLEFETSVYLVQIQKECSKEITPEIQDSQRRGFCSQLQSEGRFDVDVLAQDLQSSKSAQRDNATSLHTSRSQTKPMVIEASASIIRKFEIMFTAQKNQKSKKWKDGFLHYQDGEAKIYEEDKRTLVGKKKLLIPNRLDDEFEFETSTYLVQIQKEISCEEQEVNHFGQQRDTLPKFSQDSEMDCSNMNNSRSLNERKRKSCQAASSANNDQYAARKFEIMYTAQKKQKSKKWKDGVLFLQDGTGKIYEEDQKTYVGKKTLLIPNVLDDEFEFETPMYLVQIQQEIFEGRDEEKIREVEPQIREFSSQVRQRHRSLGRNSKELCLQTSDERSFPSSKSLVTSSASSTSASAISCNWKSNGGQLNMFPFLSVSEALEFSNKVIESLDYSIKDRYSNWIDYHTEFASAVKAELSHLVVSSSISHASGFSAYVGMTDQKLLKSSKVICSKHGALLKKKCKKSGPNHNREFFSCSATGCTFFEWTSSHRVSLISTDVGKRKSLVGFLTFMRARGVMYYDDLQLFSGSKESEGNLKKIFVKITSNRESTESYGKDDLWVFAESEYFEVIDSDTKEEMLFIIARSTFHAPSKGDGMLELEILEKSCATAGKLLNGKEISVVGVRCGNGSMEFMMLDNLIKVDAESNFLIQNSLLSGMSDPEFPGEVVFESLLPSDAMVKQLEIEISLRMNLNQSQAKVLSNCSKWFNPQIQISPICLVHGVFGSGKSHLLVALILFLSKILDEMGRSDVRILVCAATNVAVDRVLLLLQDHDFVDFSRVGSVKRIAKRILPHTIFASSDWKNDNQDEIHLLKELKELAESSKREDKVLIEEVMKELQSSNYQKRLERLKAKRVVGVTCAATMFSVLNDSVFPIVLVTG